MAQTDTLIRCDGPLIVGAGLAGLFTALKLAPLSCTVLSPEPLGNGSSSAWAQGGMAAAVGVGDTPEQHAADTITAGAGLVDPAIAALVTREANACVEDLLHFGVPFDRDAQGTLLQSREAAHGQARVLRVKGDRAGKAIMDALIAQVRQTPSITIIEGVTVDDLAYTDGTVQGVIARRLGDPSQAPAVFLSPNTVLATGGLGGLYATTTNPARVRGQSLAMAARAGAIIADPEFVQFHPTGIATGTDPTPLATEALRGHGATVIDDDGNRFILDDHPDGELAPRDIVARAIHRKRSEGHGVYLDCCEAIGAAMPDEFPTVTQACRDAGIDPVTQPIPIRPAQHYHMGGVETDAHGATTLPGLWACGEVASTGLHGANRLASNSLLEAVVFGARIAQALGGQSAATIRNADLNHEASAAPGTTLPTEAVTQLRQTMDIHLGVERSGDGIREALTTIAALEAKHAQTSRSFLNMTHAATLVAAGALNRQESRGSHARADFPASKPPHRTRMTLSEALSIRAA